MSSSALQTPHHFHMMCIQRLLHKSQLTGCGAVRRVKSPNVRHFWEGGQH